AAVLAQEDEEAVVGAGPRLVAASAQAFGIDPLAEIGFAPARFERTQELAAVAAQRLPGRVVDGTGGAQGHASSHQHRRLVAREPGEHHPPPDLSRELRPDTCR